MFICPMKYRYAHLSDGLSYITFEPFIHLAFRAFFRSVHINNRKAVLAKTPVLLAANHPTAFVDPLLLCEYLAPPIYNMTRGDIFRKPFFRKLMESANMFPVFRRRDGYVGRDRNDEVFDWCVEKLRQGQTVVIYVEGEHHLEKRVRPAQKGMARIAFEAYQRYQQPDLQVIPAGCNYQYGDRPREEAMVNIGAPIFVRDYWEEYLRSPAAAVLRLSRDVEAALKTVCFHLDSTDDDVLAEQLLTLHRSENPQPLLPVVHFDSQRFAKEKAVLDQLNEMPNAPKNGLRDRAGLYFQTLEKKGLEDGTLLNPPWGSGSWLLFLIAGFLPFLAGWLSSWPIRAITYWVADTKVKKKEFYGSIVLGVSFFSGFVYYWVWIIASLCSAHLMWIAAALLLPVLGWFSILYREIFDRWQMARKAINNGESAQLLELRRKINS